jgi:hypothetical protein
VPFANDNRLVIVVGHVVDPDHSNMAGLPTARQHSAPFMKPAARSSACARASSRLRAELAALRGSDWGHQMKHGERT